MVCTGDGAVSEFAFVRSLPSRGFNECRGPLVALSFSGQRLITLEDSFQSEVACELLYDGYLPERGEQLVFQLCAVHWMELSCLSELRARTRGRQDWWSESQALFEQMCRAAGWDPKEIRNLFVWCRRVQLTEG